MRDSENANAPSDLVARKFFVCQLFQASWFPATRLWTFAGFDFSQVWLQVRSGTCGRFPEFNSEPSPDPLEQGAVVAHERDEDDGSNAYFVLDDSTGTIHVAQENNRKQYHGDSCGDAVAALALGSEVAVIGPLSYDEDAGRFVVGEAAGRSVHVRVLDKTRDADACTRWMLDVARIHSEVYYPLL